MTDESKCPKCDAPKKRFQSLPDMQFHYECGTVTSARDGRFMWHGVKCVETRLAAANERNADLARQLMDAAQAKLAERPARLVVEELRRERDAAEERVRYLEWENATLVDSNGKYASYHDRWLRERAELRALLRRLEWVSTDQGRLCPVCDHVAWGHNSDCQLAKALADAPGDREGEDL